MARRWTSFPGLLFVGGPTLLAGLLFVWLLVALRRGHETAPTFLNAALVVLSFAAVSSGLYPYMIPQGFQGGITVYEAAAAPESLMFMLVVSVIAIPIILIYTTYEYWVYRGKTSKGLE